MGAEVTWLAADGPMDGVLEQSFHLNLSGNIVPGVLWLPVGRETPAPLVLLGHGGSGHKRNARNLELG
jgi:poly(3-hydroxybutyrate) depolymerase